MDCQCFLERVNVEGKYGLVCGEQSVEHETHSKVLLQPIYGRSDPKISSPKAIYKKYAVFADGNRSGQFTLVLNAWVPIAPKHEIKLPTHQEMCRGDRHN